MIEFLKGKKTYLMAFIAGLLIFLYNGGYTNLTQDQYEIIINALGFGAIAALRHGVETAEVKK